MASQFDGRVILASEVKISAASKHEVLTVGTTAKKLDLSVGEPVDEMVIMICGDPGISTVVYVGLSNAVSTTNYFTTVSPNEKIAIPLNNGSIPEIWAIGTAAGDKLAVLKGV